MRCARFHAVWMAVAFCLAASGWTLGGDWPQWRGPNRNGISNETGLQKDWTTEKPALLWQMKGMGRGYASVAIVGGKLYTMGDRNREQFVLAFDLESKKELWAARVGGDWEDGGARGTPTVDGERIYAIGTRGDIVCLETATGKEVWRKNFTKDFGGKMMSGWGFSESHLVDGEQVVCTPGVKDAAIVALNKKTGEVIWKAQVPNIGSKGNDGAGYSSIVVAEVGGIRQYVQLMGRGAVGVAAKDGKFLWGYNRVANGVANITTPVVRGEFVFVSSAYGTGSALLKLVPGGDGGIKAEEVYWLGADKFQNHHGGVVLVGDHIYGGHGQNAGAPVCIEFLSGEIAWRDKAPGRGSAAVLYADGNLYFRYENGLMAMFAATPEGFQNKGSFEAAVKDGPSWSHPVIVDGKLYLRSQDVLMCYDVKAK